MHLKIGNKKEAAHQMLLLCVHQRKTSEVEFHSIHQLPRIGRSMSASESRLLQAFRTVGLVATGVPFVVTQARSVVVALGRSFACYELEHLRVQTVSPPVVNGRILVLAAVGDRTYCASSKGIQVFIRAKLEKTLQVGGEELGDSDIVEMIPFGEVLVVLTRKQVVLLDFDLSGEDGDAKAIHLERRDVATCMMHPDTYLNKFLIGFESGEMELWNVRTRKKVYGFASVGAKIMCLVQSTVVDVIAAGIENGNILVKNIRLDEDLMTLHHSGGAVTSLSFHTLRPILVSGNYKGELVVWDLDEQRMLSVVNDAHDERVVKIQFLPREPLLLSLGSDNSLKMYIFDSEDGKPRLLKMRQGHSDPPTKIRYYGGDTLSTLASGADATCCQILSAGRDRSLRLFHTAREQLNREFSQGPLLKRAQIMDVRIEELKLSPIVDFAATEARERDWCNIISAHSGEGAAFTWSFENRVIGKRVLRPDGASKTLTLKSLRTDKISTRASQFPAATSVAISACGDFGLVGTADGVAFRYNLQSGLPRGSYPKPLYGENSKDQKAKRRKLDPSSVLAMPGFEDKAVEDSIEATITLAKRNPEAHGGTIYGLDVDATNETLVTAGLDGKVKFWDFVSQKPKRTVSLASGISKMTMHRDSGIVACACDDFAIVVLDISNMKVVRKFSGHKARITDVSFTKDGRWLATASVDTSLRIWDLPTARCIDWVQFPRPATSLTFSPTGEFLATTFVDSLGISLWACKTFFGAAKPDTIARQPVKLKIPSVVVDYSLSEEEEEDEDEAQEDNGDEEDLARDKLLEPCELSEGIRMSGDTSTKWYNLAHLDIIRERNRPKEPPQKPEKAPFFLPSQRSVNPVFVSPPKEGQNVDAQLLEGDGHWSSFKSEKDDGKEVGKGLAKSRSKLFRFLEEAQTQARLGENDGFAAVVGHLKEMSSSAVDFELQAFTLGPEDDDGCHLLGSLLDWILFELQRGTNFELVQAILNRVLTIHQDSLLSRQELHNRLYRILDEQKRQRKCIQDLVDHNSCLLAFFAHQR